MCGNGGQHQNKTSSGVRYIHKQSGARGESREERSQSMNGKIAFKRLTKQKVFINWCKIRASEIFSGETIEQKVDRSMQPENLRIEYGV